MKMEELFERDPEKRAAPRVPGDTCSDKIPVEFLEDDQTMGLFSTSFPTVAALRRLQCSAHREICC